MKYYMSKIQFAQTSAQPINKWLQYHTNHLFNQMNLNICQLHDSLKTNVIHWTGEHIDNN